MNRNRILAIVGIFAILLIGLTTCGVNAIPRAEENAKAKWAEVENTYQRRLDLLPNLARVARASGQQELALQIGVAEARARTAQAQINPEQLNDPAAVRRYADAQAQVSSLVNGLRVTVTNEDAPESQNVQLMRDLLSQVEGTDNRITNARRDYNLAVQEYNTTIRTFPSVLAARIIYGSRPIAQYEAQEGAERAPIMDLGNGH